MHRILKSVKKALPWLAIVYGLYLLKTILGINLSSQYSAHWLFKAPLEPVEVSRDQLCNEVDAACITRQDVKNKIRKGLKKAKRAI